MKKVLSFVLTIAAILVFSSSASPDKRTTSCRVYNASDFVVTVDTPIATYVFNQYNNSLSFSLSLNKSATEEIGISVEIYDANWNNVQNKTVYIQKGDRNVHSNTSIQGAKNGDVYYIRLASATCR